MANNFISPFAYLRATGVATGLYTIYTCPAAKKTLVRAIQISNQWTGNILATVVWQDVNNVGIATSSHYLLTSGSVSANSIRTVLDRGYIVLQSGDRIDAGANAQDRAYILISAMETDI